VELINAKNSEITQKNEKGIDRICRVLSKARNDVHFAFFDYDFSQLQLNAKDCERD